MCTNNTGEFLLLLANESHPVDRHCACGRILLDPWSIACEHCEATHAEQPLEYLPALLMRQAS